MLKGSENLPPLALLEMATGYWASQAVYVAAKLGIADMLEGGSRKCAELARATGAHPPSLCRLLRALVSLGICTIDEQKRIGLTPIGQCLQSDAPGSMRAMVLTLGEEHYQAWGNLLHSVRSGQPAFDVLYKTTLFEYLAQNAAAGRIFAKAMTDATTLASLAIVQACDFSPFSTLVDVGGGQGALLRTLLMANPGLNGILFDAPSVIEKAKASMQAHGLAGRCTVIAGDFFKSLPRGAGAYVLKNVIHDWDDEHSVAILKNCQKAMAANSRVLVIEALMSPDGNDSFASLMDLNMLVLSRGRERSEAEYRALFDSAGLRLSGITPTLSLLSVIEGARR